MKNRKLSHDKVMEIERLIPLAIAKADADMAHGADNHSRQYSFHMDQMAIAAGLRQGRLKGEYADEDLL